MVDNNVNPPLRQNSNIEKVMKKLECPFTWDMDDITKKDDLEQHLNDDKQLFPLVLLMKHIMTVYVDTKSKIATDEILKGLEKCEEVLVSLKERDHPEISFDVVHYVLQSTQCFVFSELNLDKNLDRVLSEIKRDWKMNPKESSTLKACRSICWSKYHRIGSSEAEKYIRDAIKEHPLCELWYFILGKNLRRKRRDSSLTPTPSKDEINCFEKAYRMSANPVFGVFLAQMYREMRKNQQAKDIYNKIFEQNPEGTTILLRLALGFIRLKIYQRAKECLDRVEALSPNHSMYLHYRGIYHLNHKNYEEAAKFLLEAIKDNNIPAEKHYLECAVKLNESFDVVQYVQGMVTKYSDLPEEQMQPLLLDLALAYWLKGDIPNALKNFSVAVEINPEAICITNYFTTPAIRVKNRNMYQLLHRDILPIIHKNNEQFEQSCIDNAEELQQHCDKYFAKNFNKTLNSFSKLNVKG